MNLDTKWISLAIKIAPAISAVVHGVEGLVRKRGADEDKAAYSQMKQDAAINLLRGILAGSEAAAGKDLLDDAEVEAAFRKAIDAIVAVENIIAKKRGAV